jgi:hypothetical protein
MATAIKAYITNHNGYEVPAEFVSISCVGDGASPCVVAVTETFDVPDKNTANNVTNGKFVKFRN